jgi:hypothetical protein
MLIHVDLDPTDDEKERLDYIAMLIESKTFSSDYSSDSSKCSESHKHILAVDALDCDVKAAHVEYKGFNRNHRHHDAFPKAKSSSDKGKAVKSDDPAKLPRRILWKAVHVAELPSSTNSDGLTIYEACKARQLPDGLGSLGARALHVKVRVGSLLHEVIKARLDSGADITLILRGVLEIPRTAPAEGRNSHVPISSYGSGEGSRLCQMLPVYGLG